MAAKLTSTDCQLLWHLDFRSRVSIAALSEVLRVSKAQTHRRLSRLREQGVITGFSCVLDISRFGFVAYRFYFRLNNADAKREASIRQYFVVHQFTLWVVRLLGKWDMEVVFVARNSVHLNDMFKKVRRDLGDFFLEYNLSTSPITHHFRRDYLIGETRRKPIGTYYGKEPSPVAVDALDIQILNLLSADSKLPSQTIGKRLAVSYHTVQRRIANLENLGVLQCYRPRVDFRKLGRRYVKVLLKLSAIPQKIEAELFNFFASFGYVVYVTEVLGDWQLEIECEVADNHDVYEMVSAARRRFGRYLHTSDVVEVSEELKLCYLPDGISEYLRKNI